MTDDPRKDLNDTLGRLMKQLAVAGKNKHRLAQAREAGDVPFATAKAARDSEKIAHDTLDATIAAYERASAAGVITLEVEQP